MEVLMGPLAFKYLLIFGFLCICSSNLNNGLFGTLAEETCTWTPDGNQICGDETEDHNVWTETLDEDFTERTPSSSESNAEKLDSASLNEIEMELFVRFAGQLKDWAPEDGLKEFNPEVIVLAILNAFNSFDKNDDGYIELDEIEAVLLERQKNEENSEKIREIMGAYPGGKISIFQCLNMFHKFNGGEETVSLLVPYERLKSVPPAGAKKLIQGSVQMFIDSDKDFDGKLDKDEFSAGMKLAQEKRNEMGGQKVDLNDEQLNTLFSAIDKDVDEYLTYIEFQGIIPDQSKTLGDSINEIFASADEDSDGEISEAEFAAYMIKRSREVNAKVAPSEMQISDAFNKLDINEDGSLSRDEMMAMLDEVTRAQEKRMMEAFSGFDKNGDGLLSLDELKEIVKAIEQNSGQKLDANTFMSMLDQNGDGEVSFQEMASMLTKMVNK